MNPFNNQIYLYNESVGCGIEKKREKKNEITVWCYVDNIGAFNALTAQAAGITLSCEVIMWSSEYNGQSYAEIGEKKYTVRSAVKSGGKETVKLLLERG